MLADTGFSTLVLALACAAYALAAALATAHTAPRAARQQAPR